ncbi:MAG: MltA domain-containing protein [Betaproteobacteria bacterium]|nr:MltA domain-containing protein [Betaproteobacteria bacterium]
MTRWLAFLATLLALAACAPLPPRPAVCPPCAVAPPPVKARYVQTTFAELPGWGQADLAESLAAFLAGCARLSDASPLGAACAQAQSVPAGDEQAARGFFESAFLPYRVIAPDGSREGLVTGYYEPILSGSATRTALYRFPIYGVPQDLVSVDLASVYPELKGFRLRGRLEGRRVVPYYSRAEIDERTRAAGNGDGLPAPVIAWVSDPVDLFFLQIQGSGQIRLESGARIRVGYADQNGYPYRSLGRFLVERGDLRLDQASMQGIKAWAEAHPEELQPALDYNASYVFFRELPASKSGPIGAIGAPLTAGYSLAVDPRYLPLGAPVYLDSTYPLSDRALERLALAQDTGGAIKGALRADFFWGSGDAAGALAGRMRQTGRLWLLWPRGAALPEQ